MLSFRSATGILVRGLHSAGAGGLQAPKSALAKLRKKTGYSLSLCKKALEQHEQDIVKAEEWLKAQALELGLDKASKLEGRNTAQGLIGVIVKGNCASMVELNCETDFVARNSQFHELLNEVALATHTAGSKISLEGETVSIQRSDRETLKSLPAANGQSLGDLIALNIGQIGENIVFSRAVTMTTSGSGYSLCGLTHPSSAGVVASDRVQYGRFGSLLSYVEKDGDPSSKGEGKAYVARQLCQHIIGMNPQRVGDLASVSPRSEEQIESEATERQRQQTEELEVDEEGNALHPKESSVEAVSDTLVNQDFLLDQDKTVGEVLIENGLEVKDFARYEIGRGIEMEE